MIAWLCQLLYLNSCQARTSSSPTVKYCVPLIYCSVPGISDRFLVILHDIFGGVFVCIIFRSGTEKVKC